MKIFSFFSFIVLVFSLNSEAQLRCLNIFSVAPPSSPLYYAEVIDSLNSKYNNFILDKNITDFMQPDLAAKSFTAQTKARYQAFKLRRLLKPLKNAGSWDRYDFDNFAKKLEQITFLSDLNVTKDMSRSDRILYMQARHSLLAKGLESFLFTGTDATPSMKRKVFTWVMTPFKDIYSRWPFALFYMPKLNGAVLPLDLAVKVAWEGVDKNRELLKPYLLNSQFKSVFNTFSVTYNWTLVAALFIGLPAYSYLTYSHLQEHGSEQVQMLFGPLVQHSEEMAKTDYHSIASQKSIEHFKKDFRETYGRDPNNEEMALVQKLKGF